MPLGFAHLASYPISAMALSHSGEACACFLPPSGRSPSSACVTPASIRDDAARTRANLRPRLTARDRAPRPSALAPSPLLPSAHVRLRAVQRRSRIPCRPDPGFPGPLPTERFERRDPLAGQRLELLPEPRPASAGGPRAPTNSRSRAAYRLPNGSATRSRCAAQSSFSMTTAPARSAGPARGCGRCSPTSTGSTPSSIGTTRATRR